MLVLSRKCGERIIISFNGKSIAIELMKISGSRVRIGVDAQSEIAVHREEIWKKLVAERSATPSLIAAG